MNRYIKKIAEMMKTIDAGLGDRDEPGHFPPSDICPSDSDYKSPLANRDVVALEGTNIPAGRQ